jgi:hypothetical protein
MVLPPMPKLTSTVAAWRKNSVSRVIPPWAAGNKIPTATYVRWSDIYGYRTARAGFVLRTKVCTQLRSGIALQLSFRVPPVWRPGFAIPQHSPDAAATSHAIRPNPHVCEGATLGQGSAPGRVQSQGGPAPGAAPAATALSAGGARRPACNVQGDKQSLRGAAEAPHHTSCEIFPGPGRIIPGPSIHREAPHWEDYLDHSRIKCSVINTDWRLPALAARES